MLWLIRMIQIRSRFFIFFFWEHFSVHFYSTCFLLSKYRGFNLSTVLETLTGNVAGCSKTFACPCKSPAWVTFWTCSRQGLKRTPPTCQMQENFSFNQLFWCVNLLYQLRFQSQWQATIELDFFFLQFQFYVNSVCWMLYSEKKKSLIPQSNPIVWCVRSDVSSVPHS